MPLSRPTFDLTSQPWIPCRLPASGRPVELSLHDVFARADEVVEVADPSPLVAGALHRLLLAVLHRVYGPTTVDDWERLWALGRFDLAPLDRYLADHRERFDLFHPQFPFYQTPALPERYAQPVAKLAQIGLGTTAGNNPALFSHDSDDSPRPIGAAAAARFLVANQTFAVGGTLSRERDESPSAVASHLFKSALVINVGRSLFETLLLNAVRVDGAREEPFPFDPTEDRPAWEQGPPARGTRRVRGYLDLLTWQFRRIQLLQDPDGTVRRAVIMDGWALPSHLELSKHETMVAYRRARGRTNPGALWEPIGFETERALWRDGTALIRWSRGPSDEGDTRAPRVVRWVAELVQYGILPRDSSVALAAYGLCANRSKLLLWRHERLPVPLHYLDSTERAAELSAELSSEISRAEDVERLLDGAVYELCRRTLTQEGQREDRDRVRNLSRALQWRLQYWSQLDDAAMTLIVQLPRDGDEAVRRWRDQLRQAAVKAFEGSVLALGGSVRGMQSAAVARPRFLASLAQLMKPDPPPSDQS